MSGWASAHAFRHRFVVLSFDLPFGQARSVAPMQYVQGDDARR
jgi:hypothetical protein